MCRHALCSMDELKAIRCGLNSIRAFARKLSLYILLELFSDYFHNSSIYMGIVFSPRVIFSATAKEASTGGVYIDAAHGVGAPKMEALAKVNLAGAEACAISITRCSPASMIEKRSHVVCSGEGSCEPLRQGN